MHKVAWAVLAVAGLGCSGGTGSSTSSGAPAPLTIQAYLEQQSDALCSYDERCASIRGRAYASVDACKAALKDRDALYVAAYALGLFEYYRQNFTFHEDRARACLSFETGRSCDDATRGNPDCEAALVPKAPHATGETCATAFTTTAQLCGGVTDFCANAPAPAASDCQVCTALKADGATCARAAECLSRYCTGGTTGANGVCAPSSPQPKGGGCQRSDECMGNLECDGPAGTKVCSERVAENGACDVTADNSGRNCLLDLDCVGTGTTGTCKRQLADGQPCARNPSDTASCAHVCVFPLADAATGTCGMPVMLPMGGEPCAGLHGDSRVCMQDGSVYPEFDVSVATGVLTVTRCECRIPVGNNQTCTRNDGCVAGLRCAGGGYNRQTQAYDTGACGPLLTDGQVCRGASDCASNYCERVGTTNTAQCKARPACP